MSRLPELVPCDNCGFGSVATHKRGHFLLCCGCYECEDSDGDDTECVPFRFFTDGPRKWASRAARTADEQFRANLEHEIRRTLAQQSDALLRAWLRREMEDSNGMV